MQRPTLTLILICCIAYAQESHLSTACTFFNECNEDIIFVEDFEELNTRKWKHEITMGGGGNWEFEMYVNNRTTSYVRDGSLYLHPRSSTEYFGQDITKEGFMVDLWGGPPDECTTNAFYGCSRSTAGGNIVNPITSARVSTINSFSFKYGRVEIKAKLPLGDWIWPALWLLPADNQYGGWPASGEIDLMESRGNQHYDSVIPNGGVESFGSTLHWGPYYAEDAWSLTHKEYRLPSGLLSDDYHIYGMYWDQKRLITYIDTPAQVVLNVSLTQSLWDLADQAGYKWSSKNYAKPWPGTSPFDQEYYIIMNVAVGGVNGYFPDRGTKPWSNNDPHASKTFWDNRSKWMNSWKGDQVAMKVDFVKVWGNLDTIYTIKKN